MNQRHRHAVVPRRVFGPLDPDATLWAKYVRAVRHWKLTMAPVERRCCCHLCHDDRQGLDIADIDRAVKIFDTLNGYSIRTGFEALLAREKLTGERLFPSEAIEYIIIVLKEKGEI